MTHRDEYIVGITRRLDTMQERFGAVERLRKQGRNIEESVVTDLQVTYERGLEYLETLKAFPEYKAYRVWYQRYLTVVIHYESL
jgi:hypothetical protein